MKVMVCTKCSKVKKSKAEGEERLTGKDVLTDLQAWVDREKLSEVKVIPVKCLDECKKSPVLVLRPEKKMYKRITGKTLEKVKKRIHSTIIGER